MNEFPLTPEELNRINGYSMIDSSTFSYNFTFRKLIPGGGIAEIIKSLKQEFPDESIAVADIMGSGSPFYRSFRRNRLLQGLDFVMAIANIGLTRKEIVRGNETDRTFLNGDITDNSSWNKIDNYLKLKNLNGFRLIVCRPGFGLNNLNLTDQINLLLEMTKRLNPTHGILLMQFTKEFRSAIELASSPLMKQGFIVTFDNDPTNFSNIIKVEIKK